LEFGRTGGIRTHDLLHPKQALYRAEPRSDFATHLQAGLLAFKSRLVRGKNQEISEGKYKKESIVRIVQRKCTYLDFASLLKMNGI
jgi:hypothetical protein